MDKAEELMNLPESLKQEAVELLNDVYVKKIPVELVDVVDLSSLRNELI